MSKSPALSNDKKGAMTEREKFLRKNNIDILSKFEISSENRVKFSRVFKILQF